jgi:hypothetical protein
MECCRRRCSERSWQPRSETKLRRTMRRPGSGSRSVPARDRGSRGRGSTLPCPQAHRSSETEPAYKLCVQNDLSGRSRESSLSFGDLGSSHAVESPVETPETPAPRLTQCVRGGIRHEFLDADSVASVPADKRTDVAMRVTALSLSLSLSLLGVRAFALDNGGSTTNRRRAGDSRLG